MTSRPLSAAATATLGRRAGAYAVDAAVACAVGVFAAAITLGIALVVRGAADSGSLAPAFVLAAGAAAAALLAWVLVYAAMQGGAGSIGQRALDLRLRDDHHPSAIGFWRALWRNVVWAVSCSIVVGWFTPLFDRSARHQGWHDAASHAIVVDIRGTDAAAARPPAARVPAAAVAAAPPSAWFIDRPAPPVPQRALTPALAAAPASAPIPAALPLVSPVRIEAPAPEFAPRVEPSYAPAAARAAIPLAAPPRDAAVATASAPPTAIITHVPMTRPVAAISVPVAVPDKEARFVAGAPVIAVLTWDDGTRMAVYGRTVYGRNPLVEPGIVSVPVRDETLSLSKTHFEVGGDASGAWIADRYSTNGTVVVREGGRHLLLPGLPTALRDGDRLELGDRIAIVGSAS